jgi:hypothetical protein
MDSESPAVETVQCETARELLDALSPTGRYFENEPPDSTWIFRGHAHDHYVLLPSALRPENAAALHSLAQTSDNSSEFADTNIRQAIAECTLLVRLYVELDRQGVAIPQDSAEIRELLQSRRNQLDWSLRDAKIRKDMPGWPLKELVPFMAFAQHYGLPTRLLDWTRSPFVAAYFAADPNGASELAGHAEVWALNTISAKWGRALGSDAEDQVFPVAAPRNSNPNLHAQDGLFTFHLPWNPQILGLLDRRPVDEIISGLDRAPLGLAGAPLMYRFRFPRSLTGELLWYLAENGITAGRLFPGPRGAVDAIKERVLWCEPNRQF